MDSNGKLKKRFPALIAGLVLLVAAPLAAQVPTPTCVTGGSLSWGTQAVMPHPIVDESAVQINGLIYAFGGEGPVAGTFDNYTQIYDPCSNSWSMGALMPTIRDESAAAVYNGLAYVVGGNNSTSLNPLSNLQAYNPSTNSWTTEASAPVALDFPSAAFLNGILYVAGGYDSSGNQTTVEAYDPSAN